MPHSQRRWQAIFRTFGASITAKGISIVCTFIQVPLALHYLGAESYGFWVTLIGIGIFMNFSDLGLGVGLQNLIAVAFADQKPDVMRKAYYTGAACLGLLGVATVALLLPLIALFDWASVFKISSATTAAQVRACLAVTIVAFAAGFPLNATARLVAAMQVGWIHGLWIAIGSVIALGLTILSITLSLPLEGFVAATVSAPLLQGIGMHLHMMHRLRWAHRPFTLLPRPQWREFLHTSFAFSTPQIASGLMNAVTPVALSTTVGPVASAGFNVLQRLFSPLTQGQQMLVQPFWPAFTEALRRGDAGWVRRACRIALLGTLAFLLGLAVTVAASEPLLRLWVGKQAGDIGFPLRVAVAVWLGVVMAGQPLFYLLLGIRRLRRLAIYGTFGPLAAIATVFLAGARTGAPTALSIGAAVYVGIMWTGLVMDSVSGLRNLEGNPAPTEALP